MKYVKIKNLQGDKKASTTIRTKGDTRK